jgi:hypothetical protein
VNCLRPPVVIRQRPTCANWHCGTNSVSPRRRSQSFHCCLVQNRSLSPSIGVQEKLSNQTVLRRGIGGIEIRDLGGAQRPVPKSDAGKAALEKAAEVLGPQSERRRAGLRVDYELDGLIRILKMDLARP